MALLFLGALVLVAGQAFRIPSIQPLPFVRAWHRDEQVLPVAVPPGEAPVATALVRSPLEELRDRAVAWNSGPAQGDLPCEVFLRISRHHWARLAVSRERLAELLGGEPPPAADRPMAAGAAGAAGVSPRDLLDDRDGDGDPLDPGDLDTAGSGVEVRLFCAGAEGGRG